jgi:DNA-binding XRE family transcriptional regulator
MRFSGRVYKHGSHWLAEVPLFESSTQGRTRQEALEMLQDWFVSIVDRPGFSVDVLLTGKNKLEITSPDVKSMVSLLLQRRRQESGLSLADVAERLGARSRNAYARYERGDCVPTIEKLDQLLRAISPDQDIVLHQSTQR